MKQFKLTFDDNTICVTDLCKFGAYGDVYVDKENAVAYKIFRANTEDMYEEFIRKQSFKSEVLAHKILQRDAASNIYSPKFYGTKRLTKASHPRRDITNTYYSDCCYVMEYLNCDFRKNSKSPEFVEILKMFQTLGITYTEDSDVCILHGIPKFIDIGVMGVRERVEELCGYNRSNFNFEIKELVRKELHQLHESTIISA